MLQMVWLADSYEADLIERILLLGVLVIVPLGLPLVPMSPSLAPGPYGIALLLQPFGAAAVIASTLISRGLAAALLASLWFLVTLAVAFFGLWRLRQERLRSTAEVSIDAALLYLPVGAVWLVMSRLGIQPLGFGDTIVLLTAVHFHFAGFAAPLLAGLAGRRLGARQTLQATFRFAVLGIIAGTPLVAAGLTFSPVIGLVGALVISIGLILLAVLVSFSLVPSLQSALAQVFLLISSLSSVPAMLLASVYAYSLATQTLIVDIPQMAMTHGVLNAFGFALCGLLAWTILHNPEPDLTV
jgi:hypothetical protein